MEKKDKKPTVQVLLRLVLTDKDGKVLYDSKQMPSKSFVYAYLRFHSGMFDGVTMAAPDINNVSNDIIITGSGYAQFRLDGGVGDASKGIVVGTGSAAPTNTDYKLQSILGHGTGVGQITYGEQLIEIVAVVGANVDMECKRTFTNNTGSNRTIAEVGAYVKRDTIIHCILRDVLGTSVTVPDKCSLTVYYTMRTTV